MRPRLACPSSPDGEHHPARLLAFEEGCNTIEALCRHCGSRIQNAYDGRLWSGWRHITFLTPFRPALIVDRLDR